MNPPKESGEQFMLVTVTVHRPGQTKKDKEGTAEYNRSQGLEKESAGYSVQKELIRIPEINRFVNKVNTLKEWYTMPSGIGNMVCISIDMYDEFMAKVHHLQEEFRELVRELIYDRYEELLDEQRKMFGNRFRRDDYPKKEEIFGRYKISYEVVPMSQMSQKGLNSLSQRSRQELQSAHKTRLEQYKKAQANRLIDVLRNILQRAQTFGNTGARVKSHVAYLETIETFLQEVAPQFGIYKDPRMKELVDKIHQDIVANAALAQKDKVEQVQRSTRADSLLIELDDLVRVL